MSLCKGVFLKVKDYHGDAADHMARAKSFQIGK